MQQEWASLAASPSLVFGRFRLMLLPRTGNAECLFYRFAYARMVNIIRH